MSWGCWSRAELLGVGMVAAFLSACTGPDGGAPPRDDGRTDDLAAPDEAPDGVGDQVQDDAEEDQVGDCSLCDTPCADAHAECGENCCVGWTVYRPDGTSFTPLVLSCESLCRVSVYFYGMLLVDYSTRPELRTDPELPRLSTYEYRGDGTELLVGGGFADPWASVGCLDHCYRPVDYLWVIDVRDWTMIAFEAEQPGGPYLYSGEALSNLTNHESCPSPIPGDGSMPLCKYRADVPALDETFYIGFRDPHVVWGYSPIEGTYVDRTGALPVVVEAIPVYRLSTGELRGHANLRLEDAGR